MQNPKIYYLEGFLSLNNLSQVLFEKNILKKYFHRKQKYHEKIIRYHSISQFISETVQIKRNLRKRMEERFETIAIKCSNHLHLSF